MPGDEQGPRSIGGQPRVVRVEPDPDRMAAAGRQLDRAHAAPCRRRRVRQDAGTSVRDNREIARRGGSALPRARRTWAAWWSASATAGRSTCRDVARVIDGPDEATDAVFFSADRPARRAAAPAGARAPGGHHRPREAPGGQRHRASPSRSSRKVEALRPRLLPADVHVDVTRNYGETAREKSNELVEHLLIATLSVVVAHLARHGLAQRAGGRHRGAGHPRPDPLHLLPGRLHPEPRHPLRAHLLHRHPGGRRDRGGREHRAPPPREAGPCRSCAWRSRRSTRSATPRSSPPSP